MKRLLSTIFIAGMILLFLPMMALAKEENKNVDASNFFVFTNESHGLTADTNCNLMKHTLDTHVAGVGDPWAFVNLRTGSTYGTSETGFVWAMNVGDKLPMYNPGGSTLGYSTAAIAFELVFDTPGTFNPAITYIGAKSSPKFDFYLVDKTKETEKWYATPKEDGKSYQLNDDYFWSGRVQKLKADDFLGTVDMYGDGAVDTAFLPAREVKAQSYYLVIIPNGKNDDMELLEEGTDKFCTMNLKSFAMARRPELDATKDSLAYNFNMYSFDTANIPNFGGHNTVSYEQTIDGEKVTVYGLRSKSLLHHMPFASWKYTYNYKIAKNEAGKEITYPVTSGGKNYNHTQAEVCDPYPTMLLSANDPWMVENGKIIEMVSARIDNGSLNTTLKTSSFGKGSGSRGHVMFRINIPYAGKYDLALTNNISEITYSTVTDVYFVKAPVYNCLPSRMDKYIAAAQNVGKWDSRVKVTTPKSMATVDVPVAGEYLVIFDTKNSLTYNPYTYNQFAEEDNNDKTKPATYNYQQFSVSSINLTPVEDTEISSVQLKADAIAGENESLITYESKEGVAKNTTTINAFAAYIDGTEIESDIIDITSATVGGKCTVTAPEQEGYTFLYWAKGASNKKMIMSKSDEYTFVPYSDAINLIAVYEKSGASATDKAEFYNANGDLIATLSENGIAPALPAMAGFGKATCWVKYGSNEIIKPGDEISVSGTMLFVANYEDKQKFDITVVGGSVSNKNPEYGEEVTVTAAEREVNGTKVFNCWMRDGKVVSFDREYTFKAWENATLTAVYKEFKPSLAKEFRKIILDSFVTDGENSALMAEFIGLSDAIEKGIMFGETSRSAMTTDGTQYTIVNDTGKEAIGYAILPDGTVITDR